MRSIEPVLVDSTDSLIRDDWARLGAAGLPSLAAHSSPSNSPHITAVVPRRARASTSWPGRSC